MSFLEDLSDSLDDYSGLMMLGGLVQRQGVINEQRRGAVAAEELLKLQRQQARAAERREEEALQLMRAERQERARVLRDEQKRRETTELARRECRYLVAYTAKVIGEGSDDDRLIGGTAAILCEMVDNRLAVADLELSELQKHHDNQRKISPRAINEACAALNELSQLLERVATRFEDWLTQRKRLRDYFYQTHPHPLWVAYCVPEDGYLHQWLPRKTSRRQVPDEICSQYGSLRIPPAVAEGLVPGVRDLLIRMKPKLTHVLENDPEDAAETIFKQSNGLLCGDIDRKDDSIDHASAGLARSAGPSQLVLSRPPRVNHFKVGRQVLLFLNLAEDVDDGQIVLGGSALDQVRGAYRRFMGACERADNSWDRSLDAALELDAIRDGDLTKAVRSALSASVHRANNQQAEVRRSFEQIAAGNVAQAKKMADYLEHEGDHDTASRLTRAIQQARSPLDSMVRLVSPVMKEFKRLNTPLRRAWGPGFGKVYEELEKRLRELNVVVRQSTYSPTSELAAEVDRIIARVTPACELAGLCLTWKTPRVTLADFIAQSKPRNITPASVYINALCAIAAADGEFDAAEQTAVAERLAASPINVTPAAIQNVINYWCDRARGGAVLTMIAQSIVDTVALTKHPVLVKSLMADLMTIAKADGDASYSEGLVYKGIAKQMGFAE